MGNTYKCNQLTLAHSLSHIHPHSTSHPHRLLEHAPPQREDERRRPAPAAAPLPLPLLAEPPLLPVNDVHEDVGRPVQLLLGFLKQRMLESFLLLQLIAAIGIPAGADADRPSGWVRPAGQLESLHISSSHLQSCYSLSVNRQG